VHHRLFVAGQVVRHRVGVLPQRLAQARQVAVAEDAERAGEEPAPHAVAFGLLRGQEPDQGLGHGESGRHAGLP
jgi:hypothetical protein